MPEKYISRASYFAQLKLHRDDGTIKIVTGVRRCGKSNLLNQVQNALLAEGASPDQIMTFDLDKLTQADFLNSETLIRTIRRSRPNGKRAYIFIEEIQQVDDLMGLISELSYLEDADVYATASSTTVSKRINLPRCTLIEMHPLSFAEFRAAVESDGLTAREDLSRYARLGSFPALVAHMDDPSFIEPYYELLVESLMYRDVGLRFRLRNPLSLRRVVAYLGATSGTAVSARSIAKILSAASGHSDISDITAGRYLQALTDSGMFTSANRYDIKNEREMPGISKYYLTDPAMCSRITAMISPSPEQLLENIVFLELKRRYEQVYSGKTPAGEIDFVCRGKTAGCYVQVAATGSVSDKLRTFRNLRDRYPCFVITLDQTERPENTNGVQIIPAVDWLLG